MGTVSGPASSTVGHVALWNNTAGTLLSDGGKLPVDWFNVINYGADPTGSADSTTAVSNAIAAATNGGVIYFPAGTYKVSAININTSGITLLGAGQSATVLAPSTTTGDFILVGNGTNNPHAVTIANLWIQPSAARTGGSTVRIRNGHNIVVENVSFWGTHYVGISLEGGSGQYIYYVKSCEINNCTAEAISIGNSAASVVQEVFIQDTTISSSGNGIFIFNGSGVYCTNVSILACTSNGFGTYPGSGQYAQYVRCYNVLCDTCGGYGFQIGDNGGKINLVEFVNCWGSSNANYGFNAGSSNINGLSIKGGTFTNNQQWGIVLGAGTNHLIDGAMVSSNSQSLSGSAGGIGVAGGVSGFTIVNCMSGSVGQATNQQGWGILVNAGSSNNYIIQNNRCPGNLTAGTTDGGTGTNKAVGNNLAA